VFLDLRHDKYFCLGRDQSLALAHLLKAWNRSGSRGKTNSRGGETTAIIHALADKQLAVEASVGKLATPPDVAPPISGWSNAPESPKTSIRTSNLLRVYQSALIASTKLRFQTIECTVRTVENRKRSWQKESVAGHAHATARIVATFHSLRKHYPRRHRCLFDSLALVEFLASYRIFPQWVFGVRMEPFGAHCWVQENAWVLNDTVENVQAYTPIMAI
jgi:hypothetical protein